MRDTVRDVKSSEANMRMSVLGVPVSVVSMAESVRHVTAWTRAPGFYRVFVRDVASLMAAVDDRALLALHHEADLVVPDGMPLVWLGRAKGYDIGRVAGADLMDALCAASIELGLSHYFYGGKPGIAAEAARRLAQRHPGLIISGTHGPPMREIDADFAPDAEGMAEIAAIKASRADFIWVGLSSPKQEFWMREAAPLIGQGVFLGVGAAFDFHSGAIRRAPVWMRSMGLEWLHRLISEPRRLWRRYLVLAPRFVWSIFAEALGHSRRGALDP